MSNSGSQKSYQTVIDAVGLQIKEKLKVLSVSEKFFMANLMPYLKMFYNFVFISYKCLNQRSSKKSAA
jgi:hypothetical protein